MIMNDDTKQMRQTTSLPKRRFLGRRGGFCMMFGSAGSHASISPMVTAVIMLMYRTWVTVRGTSPMARNMREKNTERPWAKLHGRLKTRILRRFSHTRRPSCTAARIVQKLSSARTICDASLDTSVPAIPIATPMLAALRAGASLTPSPVMDVISPTAWSACTIWILFSGEARAKMLQSFTTACSSSSDMASSSGPVYTSPSFSAMPSMLPMARAVSAWSPVIIFTTTPASWACRMEGMHSLRGGSKMATSPTMVRNGAWSATNSGSRSSTSTLSSSVASQSARTRRPRELRADTRSCQKSRSIGARRAVSSSTY
mmetsp:Transcript_36374/g.102484  ORF Transcript_36374/g.102484 Transcript_36374/m.102484 type:complete len:315 (+) Transcript_36374:849-1793(+)